MTRKTITTDSGCCSGCEKGKPRVWFICLPRQMLFLCDDCVASVGMQIQEIPYINTNTSNNYVAIEAAMKEEGK